MPNISQELAEALQKAAKDGRISCTAARKIAEEQGIPARSVGEAADALKIKITACELGCFN